MQCQVFYIQMPAENKYLTLIGVGWVRGGMQGGHTWAFTINAPKWMHKSIWNLMTFPKYQKGKFWQNSNLNSFTNPHGRQTWKKLQFNAPKWMHKSIWTLMTFPKYQKGKFWQNLNLNSFTNPHGRQTWKKLQAVQAVQVALADILSEILLFWGHFDSNIP